MCCWHQIAPAERGFGSGGAFMCCWHQIAPAERGVDYSMPNARKIRLAIAAISAPAIAPATMSDA